MDKAKFINIGAVNAGHKKAQHFTNRNELHAWLKKNIKPSIAILVKGSNRMEMNVTVNYLINQFKKTDKSVQETPVQEIPVREKPVQETPVQEKPDQAGHITTSKSTILHSFRQLLGKLWEIKFNWW